MRFDRIENLSLIFIKKILFLTSKKPLTDISFRRFITQLRKPISYMSSEKIIEIDGGVLEGGGQILRMATSLSALLSKPITVTNIRAGRSSPGLKAQHLTGLQLIRDLSHGKLEGDEIGSTEITFHPGELTEGSYTADTQTAGSISLLIQISYPCMIFANGPARVIAKGGTDVESAPPIDILVEVFRPIAERFGCRFDPQIVKRGYYPKGGGEVIVITVPIYQLKAIELLDPGQITRITGRAFVAGVLPIKMAHQMATAATGIIRRVLKNVDIKIEAIKEPDHKALGNGSGIIIIAETSTDCKLAGSSLGKRGIPADKVGEAAATELLSNIKHGGCVDDFLQDQLILFMALANGKSRVRTGPITLHTQTAIHIVESMTDVKFNIVQNPSQESCIIECEGLGLKGNFNPNAKQQCQCTSPPANQN